ncbi:MAG: hypothetical protein ACXVCL_15685 [Bdellovibrio sp.]
MIDLQVFTQVSDEDKVIIRSITSLEVAAGKRTTIDDLSKSDQIRVYATAASALSEQRNAEKAQGNANGFSKAFEQVKAYFEKLSDDDKSWCKSTVGNFES